MKIIKNEENPVITENTGLKGKITKRVSERLIGIKGWECVIPMFGEPKMPMELFMEDCED